MNDKILEGVVNLQLLVGFLGERGQYAWWPSNFLSSDADAFLGPVFPQSLLLARYRGVLEGAKKVHDERIGVGRVFHAFRLPNEMEQSLFDQVRRLGWPEQSIAALGSSDAAVSALKDLTKTVPELQEGPKRMGNSSVLVGSDWVTAASAAYLAAFEHGIQTFPYWSEAE